MLIKDKVIKGCHCKCSKQCILSVFNVYLLCALENIYLEIIKHKNTIQTLQWGKSKSLTNKKMTLSPGEPLRTEFLWVN